MFYGVFSDVHFSTHVVFYDVFSNVHVIYMQCSIMYVVMFYGVFNDVHVIYMRCFIIFSDVPWSI
jgi:hypothetical protein